MTISEYVRTLREQWVILLAFLLLGVAAAGSIYYVKPAEYTASLTLYVSSQNNDSAQSAFQGAQLSEDRVTSYTALVNSSRVTDSVIQQMSLTETTEELAKQISATSTLNSVLIDVSVKDQSAERAARIANAVASVFTGLVAELERPIKAGAVPAVAVRVVQPASIPTDPSSTGLRLLLLIGAVIGIVIGIGAAFLRQALDTSVKSLEQLRRGSGAPNLGNIAHDPRVPKHPLTLHDDPQSPRAEAFRQLRTNLQFIDVDQPRKVVLVTSSMPAEGKTTTLVNLAIALASAGSRVLVVEGDLRRPKVSELLGLERTAGLTTILSGRARAEQVIQPWGGGAFDVLASGPLPPNPSELLASNHMKSLLVALRDAYDMVLIDSPPLLPVTDAAAVAPSTDGAVLICRYSRTTRSQLASAAQALEAVSAPVLGTVFTMVPSSGPRAYAQYNSYYQTEDTSAKEAMSLRHGGTRHREFSAGENEKSSKSLKAPQPFPRSNDSTS